MKLHSLGLIGITAVLLACLTAGAYMTTTPVACIQVDAPMEKLFIGMDNEVTIVARQKRPVSLDQVTITGGTITGGDGRFIVRVSADTIVGITVKTKVGEVTRQMRGKRIVPVATLSMRHRGNIRLGNGELKAQGGIIPVAEEGRLHVRCEVVSFSVLRISRDDKVFRAENQGARFGEAARPIIQMARPGDLYWFRHILVRCPGQEPQLLDDITVAVD